MDISYKEVYTMSKGEAKRRIVETYLATKNLSHTAQVWHTSRHVVRKWVRRYEKEGSSSLEDCS
jgi:transposase-like protein